MVFSLKYDIAITFLNHFNVSGLRGIFFFTDTGDRRFETMTLKSYIADEHFGQPLKLTEKRILS